MTRGIVLPLSAGQRVERMKYLAKLSTLGRLDDYVKNAAIGADWPPEYTNGWDNPCPDLYYLLFEYNGGKDPTAMDPATRWKKKGKTFVNRTCDCMGAMAWCGGFDRWQPVRFKHIYKGWINTDSMIMDARREQKCFKLLPRPELGCFVVVPSGAPGHEVGHIGGVIEVPAEWDGKRDSWKRLVTVDQADRSPKPGNAVRKDSTMWMKAGAVFIVSTMQP